MRFAEHAVTCAWVRERVEDYADGAESGLARGERAALAGHAAGCDACRAEIAAAQAIRRELRAFPVYDAPASVIAAAQAVIAGEEAPVGSWLGRVPAPRLLRWIPAAAAAAALAALVATARWSGPAATESSGLAEARVERAARETVLALSYVGRYTRMTGTIVTEDVFAKRVFGTMERAIDAGVVDRGLTPPLRRVMQKTGIVETNPGHERS